jgi:hypothetical protein
VEEYFCGYVDAHREDGWNEGNVNLLDCNQGKLLAVMFKSAKDRNYVDSDSHGLQGSLWAQ